MNALIKKHTYYYNANLFDNILITAFHYNLSPSEFHVFYFRNLVILFWGEGHRLCQATTQTPGTRNNRNTCPALVFHVQTRTSILPPSLPSSRLRVAAPSQKGPHPVSQSQCFLIIQVSAQGHLFRKAVLACPLCHLPDQGLAQLSWKGPVANILGSAALTLPPAPHPISAPEDVQHTEAWP